MGLNQNDTPSLEEPSSDNEGRHEPWPPKHSPLHLEEGGPSLSPLSTAMTSESSITPPPTLSISSDASSTSSGAEDLGGGGAASIQDIKKVLSPGGTTPCSKEDLELLARLELQNKLLESDAKSLNSLASGHSRKSSSTSLVSVASGDSKQSANAEEDGEDVWQIWGSVVNEWETYFKKKNAFVKDLVRRGIPNHIRNIVWQLLCNAQSCPARELYTEYLKSSSPCEKVILRDIARTYPEHDFFREKDGPGQESLFNVMKAYSLHDREVGYCQGSAFIVGMLLLQMPEEDAFVVMVRLMEDYRLREMYKPSMAELGLCMYQLECIVQEQIPELHMHFQAQSFHTSMYASSWFLTLFTSSVSLQLACRVMDLFLSEGMEMIFRIGIAILQYCKEDLLQHDMEGMLRYFQKEMPAKCEADPDYLISLAMQVKYSCKKMKKLEKDYTSYKAKEQEEMIELRRLRTENKLLRQRIENLELESASLADRLVQGQVTRAQEAEDSYALKRELASLKQTQLLTEQELERAKRKIKELDDANSQHSSLDQQAEDLIQSMQQELISVKLREAEKEDRMQDLLHRINELESVNKCLKEAYPENTIIHIQEELIAVKLREAEAQQYIKELLQKINDLQNQLVKCVTNSTANHEEPKVSENSLRKGSNVTELQQRIVYLEKKLNESELKNMKMEMEQKNVTSDLKKKLTLLENQVKELTDINQEKIATESEDVKMLCGRVTSLQEKLAEQWEINKKLTIMLENGDADANHNTEKSFKHIGHFLETLKQSHTTLSSDEGNFEQIYKFRLSPRDIQPPGKLEFLKNKVNVQ
ncbi:ecotropic viral integration site 5 ortholog isoform X2 [Parasteatoda tepidariorum]|uniref:ecotropic viral integration site 5 ortholog isoform X2 n=1 Tax=Parasteatoda tepidariorum TaxID=114398 RepID=UPI00077FDF52|nr:ecotropic viral integration site 5 ortholog isoform X1 [Parasteatoda tepidariorum]